MASSAEAVAFSAWGCAKPTDGGVYDLRDGEWYCCICTAFAAESHLSCVKHRYWVQQHLDGRIRPMVSLQDMVLPGVAPPPPPGQPTDDRPGPPPAPPPRGQAHTAAAVSEESVNAKLAIILDKLHTKLDMILEKLGSMEARLEEFERQIDNLSWAHWE